jgi:hemerythrin
MATTLCEQLLPWHEDYGLGLDLIDDQHQRLFSLMNQVWEALYSLVEDSAEATSSLILELEHYARAHFDEEEAFMQETGYPRLESHRKAHEAFISRIHAEKDALLAGNRVSLDLLLFLRDWLISHVLVADRDYAGHAGYIGPAMAVLPEAA